MRKLILTLLTLLPLVVAAEDAGKWYIDVPIGSVHDVDVVHHEGDEYEINNNNYGIGLSIPAWDKMEGDHDPNMHYRVGTYKNSYDAQSFYFMLNPHSDNRIFNYGLLLGFVSGYEDAPNGTPIRPVVVPYVSFTIVDDFQAEIGYAHGEFAKAITLVLRVGL